MHSSLPSILSHLVRHAFGNHRSIVLHHTHTHTHTHTTCHTILASSNVHASNLSKVPFLYLVGKGRQGVCKAFGAERDFLSTSVSDDICDQRDIFCSCASSVLQNPRWPGGCTRALQWLPGNFAARVSTSLHGSQGEGASQGALDFVEGEEKVLVCLKQVSHQGIMVELWVINDAFCSFRLARGTRCVGGAHLSLIRILWHFSFHRKIFSPKLLQQPTPNVTIVKLQGLRKTWLWPLFL